jgi:hypothetical protein
MSAGRTELDEERRGWRVRDYAFWIFFVVYTVGGVLVLAQGVGAIWAHLSKHFLASLQLRELGSGYSARVASRMARASFQLPSWISVAVGYAFSLLNLVLAGFLLWLRPRDRTARLLATGMVGTAGVFNLAAQSAYEALPLLGWEAVVQTGAAIVAALAYAFALVLFADGRLVPRWKPWALAALYTPFAAIVVGIALRMQEATRPIAILIFFGLAVPTAGAAAQAYRFRRATTQLEYTQARLLFWSLLPSIGIGVWFVATQGSHLLATAAEAAGRGIAPDLTALRIFMPVFLLVPIALFAGLVRFRLWDIDRVINRTIVYGIVTGASLGLYFVVLLLFHRIIPIKGDFAVAVSTIGAMSAFIPLRRRIQDFIDRRFYRQRYDAQRTIEVFSSRLRDELDLEALAFELRGAAVRTMQPSHLTLLLKGDGGTMEWQWTYRGKPRD